MDTARRLRRSHPGTSPVSKNVSMKILSISDYVEPLLFDRFEPERFEGVDLIISCGDLPPEYLSFLANGLGVPLYYVQGNHDIRHQSKPTGDCTDIHARLVRFRGIKILGLEGSYWYNGGPHQYTENQMRMIVWKLRPGIWLKGGIDMVVTHAPPRDIHDQQDRCHRGFKSFRWIIEKYSPKVFVHGHIHFDASDHSLRESTVNRTRVINTCGYYLFEVTHA
jgi:predicted phosphodiesterase